MTRVGVGVGLLFSLLVAEAYYQRRVDAMQKFQASLETLSASLGDLQLSLVTMRMAYQRFADAARRVAEEGYRRAKP